ncbi:hypothetical protein A3D14_02720 [Candidatus Saccharibacteria bacterium RIFCSPHIGHO2_02_FULL_47_12]|nr:MAG: hypothetical protein A3D14_02720 [Candidatus Saccharibacteria bacterium RIFCSPHIGHO2_02_FULL_47_12]
MKRVVISGGPSTGKSTTFEMLREEFPDAHFVREAAERVIKRELAKQKEDSTYDPIMPVTNYHAFAPLVMEQQIEDEANIPPDTELVFMDRCIIDNLGYLAYNGITEHVAKVHQHLRVSRYTVAFFCDWLDKFEQTEVRRETPEQGLAVHRHLEAAYGSVELQVVSLPAVSPEERIAIIRQTIETI